MDFIKNFDEFSDNNEKIDEGAVSSILFAGAGLYFFYKFLKGLINDIKSSKEPKKIFIDTLKNSIKKYPDSIKVDQTNDGMYKVEIKAQNMYVFFFDLKNKLWIIPQRDSSDPTDVEVKIPLTDELVEDFKNLLKLKS